MIEIFVVLFAPVYLVWAIYIALMHKLNRTVNQIDAVESVGYIDAGGD